MSDAGWFEIDEEKPVAKDMPLGQNNPLVRRVKRHAGMAVLFRVAEPISAPRTQPGQPGTMDSGLAADFAPPILDETPVEVVDPRHQAIRLAERPSSSPGAEMPPVAAIQPALEPPIRQTPVPPGQIEAASELPTDAPQPPAVMRETAAPSPATEKAVSGVESSDQDWGGTWGRLKNIMRRHEAPSDEPEDSAGSAEPAAPPPSGRKKLADVQRRTSEAPQIPPSSERRRASVEYIKPGQPPTQAEAPDQPLPDTGESVTPPGGTIQRAPAEQTAVEQTAADPPMVKASFEPSPSPVEPPGTTTVTSALSEVVDEPATPQPELTSTEVVAESQAESPRLLDGEPDRQEIAGKPSPSEPAVQRVQEATGQAELPAKAEPEVLDKAAQGALASPADPIRRAVAEAAPDPSVSVPAPVETITEPVEPVVKPAETFPEPTGFEETGPDAPEPGLGQRLLGAARRLFGGDRPAEPGTIQREAETASISGEVVPAMPGRGLPSAPAGEEPLEDGLAPSHPATQEPYSQEEVQEATVSAVPESGSRAGEAIQRSAVPHQGDRATATKPAKMAKAELPEPDDGPPDGADSPVASFPSEIDRDELETIIAPHPGTTDDQPRQPYSLDQAWPVQKVAEEPPPEPEAEPPTIDLPQPRPEAVIQRRTGRGDESASQVDQALRKVAPGQQSDSAVELVTPRRPRPTLTPKQPPAEEPPLESKPEAHEREDGLPASGPSQDLPSGESPSTSPPQAAPASVQRQALASQPSPTPAQRPAEPPGPVTSPQMVPTEIGDLPSDFWALLGQEPPKPASPVAAQPAVQSSPTSSAIQRTQAPAAKADTMVVEAPASERPSLDHFISQEWQVPLIQRADGDPDGPARASGQEVDEDSPANKPDDQLIEKLAQAVYARLKRRLAIERERSRGRY